MPSSFSVEIVDLFLSFLHSTPLMRGNGEKNYVDKSTAVTVGRCGLVCRSWVSSSRRVLFYRVELHESAGRKRFTDVLENHDYVTFWPFVRELVFATSIFEGSWIATVLPRILESFPPSLYLLRFDIGSERTFDHSLPCTNLLGITHLEICNVTAFTHREVFHCIASFPVLQALKLWVSTWRETASSDDPPAPPKTLRSLDLNFPDFEPILSWINRGGVPVSSLALYFDVPLDENDEPDYEGNLDYAAEYIESLGTSLERLSLRFDAAWRVGASTRL